MTLLGGGAFSALTALGRQEVPQTLEGPFSAVSTPNFASTLNINPALFFEFIGARLTRKTNAPFQILNLFKTRKGNCRISLYYSYSTGPQGKVWRRYFLQKLEEGKCEGSEKEPPRSLALRASNEQPRERIFANILTKEFATTLPTIAIATYNRGSRFRRRTPPRACWAPCSRSSSARRGRA